MLPRLGFEPSPSPWWILIEYIMEYGLWAIIIIIDEGNMCISDNTQEPQTMCGKQRERESDFVHFFGTLYNCLFYTLIYILLTLKQIPRNLNMVNNLEYLFKIYCLRIVSISIFYCSFINFFVSMCILYYIIKNLYCEYIVHRCNWINWKWQLSQLYMCV